MITTPIEAMLIMYYCPNENDEIDPKLLSAMYTNEDTEVYITYTMGKNIIENMPCDGDFAANTRELKIKVIAVMLEDKHKNEWHRIQGKKILEEWYNAREADKDTNKDSNQSPAEGETCSKACGETCPKTGSVLPRTADEDNQKDNTINTIEGE